MRENVFQAKVIKELRSMYPGCVILKNDSGYLQGISDLSLFWGRQWAWLEVKVDEDYEHSFRPNQPYYLNLGNSMSFAAVITPFNKHEVYRDLQDAFTTCWCPRHSEP